jgi:hypothetical protein
MSAAILPADRAARVAVFQHREGGLEFEYGRRVGLIPGNRLRGKTSGRQQNSEAGMIEFDAVLT